MFRFSIREIALVTLVVATGIAWWLQYRHLQSHRLELEKALAVERAEKARMLEYSNEITHRLRQADKFFDRAIPSGNGLGGASAGP